MIDELMQGHTYSKPRPLSDAAIQSIAAQEFGVDPSVASEMAYEIMRLRWASKHALEMLVMLADGDVKPNGTMVSDAITNVRANLTPSA